MPAEPKVSWVEGDTWVRCVVEDVFHVAGGSHEINVFLVFIGDGVLLGKVYSAIHQG